MKSARYYGRAKIRSLQIAVLCLVSLPAFGQPSEPDSLFAMVYTTGKNWDHGKKVHEQAYFMAHSKHLKTLREEGNIVM